MVSIAQPNIRITKPRREFKGHESLIAAIAAFPDGCRMVTASYDKALCLWNLENGTLMMKMEGHHSEVEAVAVSGDGKLIASGDLEGEFLAWDGDTGKSLTQAIKGHSERITSLQFSPDKTALATVSLDKMIQLWRTDTWENRGHPINSGGEISCVRYSPSGEFLAISTSKRIQIWDPNHTNPDSGPVCVAQLRVGDVSSSLHFSLAWSRDGTRLFSAGSFIQEWDTSTWNEVGYPWSDHTDTIYAIALNSTGTLIASTSYDNYLWLWRLSDRQNIAVFKAPDEIYCITFSTDGNYILWGGYAAGLAEWAIPSANHALNIVPNSALAKQGMSNPTDYDSKNASICVTVCDACVSRNSTGIQKLFAQHNNVSGSNYTAYTNKSFEFSRKCDWDNALRHALMSVGVQPSFMGYISQGVALCGKMEFIEAMGAFDLVFMFTDQDKSTLLLLLLVKAIALFNGNKHKEAMRHIRDLANACPNADTLACQVVEAYLQIQLGINALTDKHYNEASEHFATAINFGVLSNEQAIHSKYEIFVIIFGWELVSSWKIANQNRCNALLLAGRQVEAHDAYGYMMDMADEATKASCFDWCIGFKQQCSALYALDGDTALDGGLYDKAIELYSTAIDLDSTTDTYYANRCRAKLGKMLWKEALVDAEKVTELSPSSYLGYSLKYASFHGSKQYDEAIGSFEVMMSKLDAADDPGMQVLRQQCISLCEARGVIRDVIDAQMEDTPPRLFDTSTSRLCNREAHISAFTMTTEYSWLLSSIVNDANLRIQRIQDTVAKFFRFVMLSHRWETHEALLHEIQDKVIYELHPVGGIAKLQSFCKVVRDAGYRWAWIDTCCIDQNNNVEVQRSINSMFAWYRHSTLTIIFLSDVLPSSESGAMARSIWNTRGWTLQEFLAPKIVRFYKNDWTLYLNDHSRNHKESAGIMRELEDATGIHGLALTAFCPGVRGVREKLQWASMRSTMLPEDIAYSLFGIFHVHLPVIYGERKESALGRLLQEVIAQSGDISCLDWVGKSSAFNSCLPASITSYAALPLVLPSLSEDEMETSISSLRDASVVELASQLYTTLEHLTAPRFAQRRLHLPCIAFAVKEVALMPSEEDGAYSTYMVKANGLNSLLITTEDKLIPFSHNIRQKFLLVRPWDRNLLELYNFVEPVSHAGSIMAEDPPSQNNAPIDSESDSRWLRLVVRLGQPFRAFLLAQQWGGEYSRIAADHEIIAQVKDIASVRSVMDVRTLEIL